MNIESLFSNAMFGNEVPTMITTLPEVLFEECKIMKQACDELRSHPYSFLKEHHNAGKNSYQVSVPQNIIENSFLYPYILYAGQYYLQHFKNIPMKTDQRNVRLRNNINHFDAYDFWINYSNQGNYNPPHTHRDGLGLSGVIYFTSNPEPTVFENRLQFQGSPGQVILFPSSLEHSVPEQQSEEERITFAFNLEYK